MFGAEHTLIVQYSQQDVYILHAYLSGIGMSSDFLREFAWI